MSSKTFWRKEGVTSQSIICQIFYKPTRSQKLKSSAPHLFSTSVGANLSCAIVCFQTTRSYSWSRTHPYKPLTTVIHTLLQALNTIINSLQMSRTTGRRFPVPSNHKIKIPRKRHVLHSDFNRHWKAVSPTNFYNKLLQLSLATALSNSGQQIQIQYASPTLLVKFANFNYAPLSSRPLKRTGSNPQRSYSCSTSPARRS